MTQISRSGCAAQSPHSQKGGRAIGPTDLGTVSPTLAHCPFAWCSGQIGHRTRPLCCPLQGRRSPGLWTHRDLRKLRTVHLQQAKYLMLFEHQFNNHFDTSVVSQWGGVGGFHKDNTHMTLKRPLSLKPARSLKPDNCFRLCVCVCVFSSEQVTRVPRFASFCEHSHAENNWVEQLAQYRILRSPTGASCGVIVALVISMRKPWIPFLMLLTHSHGTQVQQLGLPCVACQIFTLPQKNLNKCSQTALDAKGTTRELATKAKQPCAARGGGGVKKTLMGAGVNICWGVTSMRGNVLTCERREVTQGGGGSKPKVSWSLKPFSKAAK